MTAAPHQLTPPSHAQARPPVRRLAAITLLLTLAVVLLQRPLIEALLPWLRWCTDFIDTTYRTIEFGLQPGAGLVLQRTVTLAGVVVVGGQVLMPDPLGLAVLATPAGHVLHAVVLGLAVVLAWPASRMVLIGCRLAILVPLLAAVSAIDVPAVLAAMPWALHVEALEPTRFSPLLIWADVMQGGGRLVLGIAAGWAAVILAARCRLGHP
jgi:hypothetical protein